MSRAVRVACIAAVFALMSISSSGAVAYLVDFEGVGDNFQDPILAVQGFDFDFDASGWGIISAATASANAFFNPNGTAILGAKGIRGTKDRHLRELLIEHFGTSDGRVVLPLMVGRDISVISWAPPPA